MNSYFRSLSGLCLAFLALSVGAKEISGRVVAVADGNTATVLVAGNQQVWVRLADGLAHSQGGRSSVIKR